MVIKTDDLFVFLKKVKLEKFGGFDQVILPATSPYNNNGQTFFQPLTDNKNFILDSYRTVDPTKILFYLSREQVFPEKTTNIQRLILGVKSCDLHALFLLDHALINEEFVDPAYRLWRENAILVTSDCCSISEFCHCNLVGGKPYCDSGFDMNLSPVNGNMVITVGSEKGEKLLKLLKSQIHVEKASDNLKSQVEQNRNKIVEKLAEHNVNFNRQDDYSQMRSVTMEAWHQESQNCVGCGACTHICPTCYCLILNDETKAEKFIKERSYDSCQLNGYARVAGGGSPRPKMEKRFRNRYLCKFDYMQSNFDQIGCTGCGRCSEACAGKIDFRKVVSQMQKSLVSN